jgi:hypothetical protein
MVASSNLALSCLSTWNNLAQTGGIFLNFEFLLKFIDGGTMGYLCKLKYLLGSDLTVVRYMKMYVNLYLLS